MTRRYLRLGACARRLSLRARAPLLGCGRGCSSVRRRRRLLRQLAARGGEVRLRGRRARGRVGGGRARGLAGAQLLQRLRQVRGGRLQLRQRARAAAARRLSARTLLGRCAGSGLARVHVGPVCCCALPCQPPLAEHSAYALRAPRNCQPRFSLAS